MANETRNGNIDSTQCAAHNLIEHLTLGPTVESSILSKSDVLVIVELTPKKQEKWHKELDQWIARFCPGSGDRLKIMAKNVRSRFIAARLAIYLALKELGIKGVENLDIENNHYLKESPDVLIGISHTQNLGICYADLKGELHSLGVDMELLTRKTPSRLHGYIAHPQDESEHTDLELWCLKEASYKAFSPFVPASSKFVLKDVAIHRGKAFCNLLPQFEANTINRKISIQRKPYLLALAAIKNRP